MRYSYEFKTQAVEKALRRDPDISLRHMAGNLGIDYSTLRRWINQFENHSEEEQIMNKEKTPLSWTAEQKLQTVIACESMDEAQISAHCREHGVYPHHVKQWKSELLKAMSIPQRRTASPAQIKQLREENKSLKKQLRRKDKALAETAALLVLKKKAEEIWGTEEDY